MDGLSLFVTGLVAQASTEVPIAGLSEPELRDIYVFWGLFEDATTAAGWGWGLLEPVPCMYRDGV